MLPKDGGAAPILEETYEREHATLTPLHASRPPGGAGQRHERQGKNVRVGAALLAQGCRRVFPIHHHRLPCGLHHHRCLYSAVRPHRLGRG